jgi:cell division protein ZapA
MAQVTVTINGRAYPIACKEGEEERIGELARYVDGKVSAFAGEFGNVGEARLLLLTALVLADELADAQAATGRARAAGNGAADGRLATGIDNLAARLEAIAARLETSHI